MAGTGSLPPYLLCLDVGSTFTKAALVDTERAELLATTQHRTTIDTDVMDGIEACRADLGTDAPMLVCSSAGGGLRIAVVGNEELVTAEAGRRVALSSGGKVVAVLAGGLDESRYAALLEAEPDVVLLVGGTDGGNAEQFLADAWYLADHAWSRPVVVAGDAYSQYAVADLFVDVPHVLAENVVPRIGVLSPDSARRAMREVFLSHVIGGKGLSDHEDFADLVLGPTPDVVLLGVEALAGAHGSRAPGSGVVVVDVGGATTDVHSVVVPDPEEGGLAREVVATTAVTRTVEGDLGLRWSAETTATAAAELGLEIPADRARARAEDPGFLAGTPAEEAVDRNLARAAVLTAIRRHAGRSRVVLGPGGRVVERSGKDLRAVDLLVGSGGVLREGEEDAARGVLAAGTGADPHGWQVPEDPVLVIDRASVLAAAGLVLLYGERHGQEAEAARVARGLIWTSVLDNR